VSFLSEKVTVQNYKVTVQKLCTVSGQNTESDCACIPPSVGGGMCVHSHSVLGVTMQRVVVTAQRGVQ